MINKFNEKFEQVGLPFKCKDVDRQVIVDFGNGRQTTLDDLPYEYDDVISSLSQLQDTPLVENIYHIDPMGIKTRLNVNGYEADIDMMNMVDGTSQFAMFIPFQSRYQSTEEGITFKGVNRVDCKLFGDLYYHDGARNIRDFEHDLMNVVNTIKSQQKGMSDAFFKNQDSLHAVVFQDNKTDKYDYDYKSVELHTLPDNQVGIKMSMEYDEMLDIPSVVSMRDPNIAQYANNINVHLADQSLTIEAYSITDADNVSNEVERISHALDRKMEDLQTCNDVVITNDDLLELSDAMEL